jgi:hypothetical protein
MEKVSRWTGLFFPRNNLVPTSQTLYSIIIDPPRNYIGSPKPTRPVRSIFRSFVVKKNSECGRVGECQGEGNARSILHLRSFFNLCDMLSIRFHQLEVDLP